MKSVPSSHYTGTEIAAEEIESLEISVVCEVWSSHKMCIGYGGEIADASFVADYRALH